MADVARARSMEVDDSSAALPGEVDAVVSQHAAHAVEMAERYPGTPLAFVTHGVGLDCMLPPQVAGVTSCVVALNDRTARRAAASALCPEVVRLRQPIDLNRFSPRGPVHDEPRRVLLMGNYLRGGQRDHLLRVCRELGLEHTQVGAHGSAATPHPESIMGDADIVVGYGRSALEGMACGRAVFVYDHSGGDGWVTAESYSALEADGFAGTATPAASDLDSLRHALAGYRAEMGAVGRELARKHHDARRHGVEMAELLARLAPPGARESRAALDEISRVLRSQWQSDGLAASMALEAQEARERLDAAESELERLRLREAQFEAGEVNHAAFTSTRRYRLAGALATPVDRLRRRLGLGPR